MLVEPLFVRFEEVRPFVLADGVTGRPLFGAGAMLNLIEFEPGSTVPLHSHDHEQLGIVIQGMQALVQQGTVPGLIGYEDGVPVAWVSLGPRDDFPKLRRSPIMKPVDDLPVWSIVCFFVDRDTRGRGLAARMLDAAIDFARAQGARLIEAYPVDADTQRDPDSMFFGAKSMYDRAGFREVARRRPARAVVRRPLRPRPAKRAREPGG